MFQFFLSDIYKEGDELHLAHVIPKLQLVQLYGVPPIDFMPQQSPEAYDELIRKTEEFIGQRFLSKMPNASSEATAHIIKGDVDADSIGHVLCNKAAQLDVALVCVASHSKTKLQEFFIGSVAKYLAHHCSKPLLLAH